MSNFDLIPYKVKDSNNFITQDHPDSKRIDKINEKSKEFTFCTEENKYEVLLILNHPAIINKVEYKVKNCNSISFDFQNGAHTYNRRINFEENEIKEGKMKYFELKGESQCFESVKISFLNFPEPMKTSICCIILKGFKQHETDQKQRTVKNVSEHDTFELASKKKNHDEAKEAFNARNKERSSKVTPPDKLCEEAEWRKQNKNYGGDFDEELRKAIEASRKSDEEQKKSKKKENNESKNEMDMDNIEIEDTFFDYDVVEYEKVKKVYEHVTTEWLEAQSKAEKQANIQNRHKISSKIKPKLFPKQDFCINNINGQVRSSLMILIKELGGSCIDNPKDNCFVVTNKMEGGKINLSTSMNNIKYVSPEYVNQCAKLKIKLDVSDFYPHS